jgi:hypothetical protein
MVVSYLVTTARTSAPWPLLQLLPLPQVLTIGGMGGMPQPRLSWSPQYTVRWNLAAVTFASGEVECSRRPLHASTNLTVVCIGGESCVLCVVKSTHAAPLVKQAV